jgi:hypothetical protein
MRNDVFTSLEFPLSVHYLISFILIHHQPIKFNENSSVIMDGSLFCLGVFGILFTGFGKVDFLFDFVGDKLEFPEPDLACFGL